MSEHTENNQDPEEKEVNASEAPEEQSASSTEENAPEENAPEENAKEPELSPRSRIEKMSDDEIVALLDKADKSDLYLETLQRTKADFENYQKRMDKERNTIYKYANQDLLKSLLTVMSHFEMATASAANLEVPAGFLDGVKIVQNELDKVLRDSGVTAIEAVGKPFDPNFHEAMQQMESADHPPMTVMQEYEKGYMLHDRLLRPSKVIVSKEAESS